MDQHIHLEASQRVPSEVVPPLDTLVLRLSDPIERDLERRAVFPALRRARAVSLDENQSTHYLSPEAAQAVLEDALACAQSAPGTLRVTYGGHVFNLRAAFAEAAARVAAFEAPAAVCTCDNRTWRIWRGTREQLEAVGVYLRGPWPTEPGGKRWAVARGAEGRHTILKPAIPPWPGLLEARIDIRSRPRTVAPRVASKPRVARASGAAATEAKWEWLPDGGRRLRGTPPIRQLEQERST